MSDNPTATLTQPTAITTVTSARKSLVVTYSLGTVCSRLIISVPHVARECECAFSFGGAIEGIHEFAILQDEAGHRYCEPGPWVSFPNNLSITVRFAGLTATAGVCMTGVEQFNDAEGFPIPLVWSEPPCANCRIPQTGGYAISTRTVTGTYCDYNPPVPWEFSVDAEIAKDLDGLYDVAVHIRDLSHVEVARFAFSGPVIEGAVWGNVIPPYQGWLGYVPLDRSNAYAVITAGIEYYRLRPTFDDDGNLTSVVVELTYDEDDPNAVSTVLTYTPEAPVGCSELAGGVTLTSAGLPYQFPETITASVTDGMDVATIGTGDLRVIGPLGYDEIARFDSGSLVGGLYVATYSVPPPENNIWCWQYNGTYTVSMVAQQVADENGNFVEAGTLGTFACAIDGKPILEPLFLAGYLMAATEILVFPMELSDGSDLDDDATPTVLILTTAGSWVAPASGPTNIGEGHYSVTVTSATHFPGPGTVHLKATAAGCKPTCRAYKAGPIAADEQAIDGDFEAPKRHRDDLIKGYAYGVVIDDSQYGYGYGYSGAGCTPTTTVFCVEGLKPREDSEQDANGRWHHGYAEQFVRIEDNPTWKRILKSATYGPFTEITLEHPLYLPPTVGATITIGGCTEVKSET